jgi:predicted  nucleic acid-binding Zn-ribbon protein
MEHAAVEEIKRHFNVAEGLRADIRVVIEGVGAITDSFDRVEFRLDAVEKRLDRVEIRLDAVEERLGKVEIRLDGVETKIDRIDTKLDSIEIKGPIQ